MTTPLLIALDLDGTLLDDQKRVSSRNLNVLRTLLESGVKIAIASARDCASISHVVPLNLPGLYYIASGGALIYDSYASDILLEAYLTPPEVNETVAFLQQFGHPVFLNNDNDYLVDRLNDRVEMIEQRYHLKTQLFARTDEVKTQVMRVSLAAPIKILRQAAALAESTFGARITVSLASPDWLDLLPSGSGKGALLQILQSRLGIQPEQTLAIGDYESDLSLFAHSGVRIAMGNAVAVVKASATHLTDTNNADGVAGAIERYFPEAVLKGQDR